MSDADPRAEGAPSWGTHTVATEETLHWRLGPLELWARRRAAEWRVAHRSSDDFMAERCDVTRLRGDPELPADVAVERFAFRRTDGVLELAPATADRAMVVKPELPFHLLPGEVVTLFVTTPLWLRVRTSAGAAELLDVPTSRPSDTWFGPLTRPGELCYASRTSARLELDDLQRRTSRGITAVEVKNLAHSELLLEHIRLPLPTLALYRDREGFLWTDTVGLTMEAKAAPGEVSIEVRAPVTAGDTERVAGPRRAAASRYSFGAFASRLGLTG
ncbi:MAG: hypothetical protein R3A79_07540 [Nannocystaceae bacterium]